MWQAMMAPIMQAAVDRSEFQLDRLMGQDNTFEQPWGKGPYWDAFTIPDLERNKLKATVRGAKESGLHPLFALGKSGSSGPAHVSGMRQTGKPPSGSGPHIAASMSDAQIAESKARAANQHAQADYYRSQSNKAKQAAGGAPVAAPFAEAIRVDEAPDVAPPGITKKSQPIRGPFGGLYRVPKGVSPQGEWEEIIGELSDWTVGPGIAARMYRDRAKRMKQHATQVKKAKQQKHGIEGFRKKRKSRFDRWFRSK